MPQTKQTQIRLIAGYQIKELEEKVNQVLIELDGKDIVDIKMVSDHTLTVIIIYR